MKLSVVTCNGYGTKGFEEKRDFVEYHDDYTCAEPGESEFQFSRRYKIRKRDFVKGVRKLSEKGRCDMLVSVINEWPERSSKISSIHLKLENEKIIIESIKTPWTLGEMILTDYHSRKRK